MANNLGIDYNNFMERHILKELTFPEVDGFTADTIFITNIRHSHF